MPTRSGPVAALYDVHGNLPALDAVLADVAASGAEGVVVGGDVVLGPMPAETLRRLRGLALPVEFIRGNCDRLTVDAGRGTLPAALPMGVRERLAWTAAALTAEERDFLAGLPPTLEREVEGMGLVHFCHATPRSDEEILTPRTPESHVRPMLAAASTTWIVCGHTHVQFGRALKPWRVVNAGSVGMSTAPAVAHWLLLDGEPRWRSTPYDATLAAATIEASGFPGAADFAARHVRSAPTANDLFDLLEPIEG